MADTGKVPTMGFNFTQFFQKEEPVVIAGNAAAVTAMGIGYRHEHDHYEWDLSSMELEELFSLGTLVFLTKVL